MWKNNLKDIIILLLILILMRIIIMKDKNQSEGGEAAAAARPIKIPGRVGLGGLLLSPFPFPFPFLAGGSRAAGCEN